MNQGAALSVCLQVPLPGLKVVLLYYEWDWYWGGEDIVRLWQNWDVRYQKSHR